MKIKKLKKIIMRVLVGLTLAFTLCAGCFTVKAYKNNNFEPYVIKESSINYKEVKEVKGKILIYHTHNNEKYIDSNVIEMGKDLAKKLEKKGYIVDHIEKDFEKNDYNNAYYKSREFLKGIDLDEYNLIIDMHRDAIDNPNTVVVNDVPVAKGMFVYANKSENYNAVLNIGDGIVDNMKKFDSGLMRNNWEYNKGITYFNSDLDDNILLLEAGNQNNSKLEIMRLNTYITSSIDVYLENLN